MRKNIEHCTRCDDLQKAALEAEVQLEAKAMETDSNIRKISQLEVVNEALRADIEDLRGENVKLKEEIVKDTNRITRFLI
jgi:formiminotetrahydrofolate cyclodeaminase